MRLLTNLLALKSLLRLPLSLEALYVGQRDKGALKSQFYSSISKC